MTILSKENWRDLLAPASARILQVQRADGAIPWFEDGVFDPWNHVESAMALDAMGEREAANRAYAYLRETQLEDGSWLAGYGNCVPMQDEMHMARGQGPEVKDSNFTAYVCVGLWRRFLQYEGAETGEADWNMASAAMDFVLNLQSPLGDISWSREGQNTAMDDALWAGNASIYKAIECAAQLGEAFYQDVDHLWMAWGKLGDALRTRPERFDRLGEDRSAFAMDWYYPVLTGTLDKEAGRVRLAASTAQFVEEGLGCRCVVHEPWSTIAESAELALTYIRLGDMTRAEEILNWQMAHRDKDGVFWMGWQFEMNIFWPEERPSWTQAAMILACEALYETTPPAKVLVM